MYDKMLPSLSISTCETPVQTLYAEQLKKVAFKNDFVMSSYSGMKNKTDCLKINLM